MRSAAKRSAAATLIESAKLCGVEPRKYLREANLRAVRNHRIYCGREGNTIVILLSGGDKRSQAEGIERAEAYWRDYRSREHDKD